MYRLTRFNPQKPETFEDLVVDALLARDDHVKVLLHFLKLLWVRFDASVSIEHVQDAILCISKSTQTLKPYSVFNI